MNNEQIQELKRLAQAATPGPWVWHEHPDNDESMAQMKTAKGEVVFDFGDATRYYPTEGTEPDFEDVAFMVAANPAAVLELIAQIESPTPSANEGVGTIDMPEFWMLAQAWGNADQFKQRLEQAQKLVAHIDQHVAAVVAQKQGAIDLLNRQYCELETALAIEHDELLKLRKATPAPVSAAAAVQPPHDNMKRGTDNILPRAECDGGHCGIGGFCEACPAVAVGNERANFERDANNSRFFPRELDFAMGKSPSGCDEYLNTHMQSRWDGWLARAALATAMRQQQGDDEYRIVGEAKGMPATSGGFTMCAFKSSEVPSGAVLFIRIERAAKQAGK